MTDTSDRYAQLLMTSSKHKMRATAKLAEATPAAIFEACVLLHEAARIERRALDELTSPSASTRLVAAIEECYCLIEGRDPPGAASAWELVVHERAQVDAATAAAMLARLEPKYHQALKGFQELLAKCKTLVANLRAGHSVSSSRDARAAELRDVKRVLRRFPGAAGFWWRRYRLEEADGSFGEAWAALSNARQLKPENPRYTAVSLILAVKALPLSEADAHVQQVRASLGAQGPEVCLMYAHAELELAESTRDRSRWQRAREAIELGLSQQPPPDLLKNLHATQLIVRSLLAGQEPTLDLLYEVGLGAEVAAAPPGGRVLDLVARRSHQQVSASPLAA
jgi:tetratricopeptide (TPR) repeat protein